ncbi:MAG TPA: glycerate kinase [Actinomycetota bacterium]|nr:glycerate kinase [Actinomycetota bacterium]
MRILLAPDKFKGTLDSAAAAQAMAAGAREVFPAAEVWTQPLADGGEGSLDCVAAATAGAFSTLDAQDAFGAPATARVLVRGETALIAMHETQLLRARPTPAAALRASTRGTGIVLAAAARAFPGREIVVFVGGSASTDGGAGAAQANGWRLLDPRGRDLEPGGGALRSLARIEPPPEPFPAPVTGACDVANLLLGDRGAAAVFARQKGAGAGEVRVLEDGLSVLADRLRGDLGVDVSHLPCGGAGGGMGAGLAAFFGARLERAFDRIALETSIRKKIEAADAVVTGEGRIDAGTLGGKVVEQVARLCTSAGKPCFVVTGEVALPATLLPAERTLGVTSVATLVDSCGRRDAFTAPAACIRDVTARLLARQLGEAG